MAHLFLPRALLGIALAGNVATCWAVAEPREVYGERCASCHGLARYGGYAPPLIPESLTRKSDEELAESIRHGLVNTQMPSFHEEIDDETVKGLVGYLREPVGPIRWGAEDIAGSRLEPPREGARIPPGVRRENLILVVERGSGRIAVLDGDSLRELDRFEVGPVHGGPKFDRDLRRVFAATRDGTLVAYDLESGFVRAKVKVAVNTRNIAASPDGAFVAAANQLPAHLVVLDGELHPLAVFPLPGQPSAVYQVPGEDRFILALRGVPQLLSLHYPALELRSSELPEPFEDFAFVPGGRRVVASSRGGQQLLLYDLDRSAVVAALSTQGLPHLFSVCFFERDGRLLAAFNHLGVPRLSVVDMESFRVVKELELAGSGFFVRTHPGSPYLWADTNGEQIQLVEKSTLTLLPTPLVPEPGKKAMHVEFTAEGERAMVSVWHEDGAVVVYDSHSLEEVARLPYNLPVGKYNARNKTRFLR